MCQDTPWPWSVASSSSSLICPQCFIVVSLPHTTLLVVSFYHYCGLLVSCLLIDFSWQVGCQFVSFLPLPLWLCFPLAVDSEKWLPLPLHFLSSCKFDCLVRGSFGESFAFGLQYAEIEIVFLSHKLPHSSPTILQYFPWFYCSEAGTFLFVSQLNEIVIVLLWDRFRLWCSSLVVQILCFFFRRQHRANSRGNSPMRVCSRSSIQSEIFKALEKAKFVVRSTKKNHVLLSWQLKTLLMHVNLSM